MFFLKYFERKRNRELAIKKMDAATRLFHDYTHFVTPSQTTIDTMTRRFNHASGWLLDKPTLRAAFPEKDPHINSLGEFSIPRLSAAGDSALKALGTMARDAQLPAMRIEATKKLFEIYQVGKKIWNNDTQYITTGEIGDTIRKNISSDNPDIQATTMPAFEYMADHAPHTIYYASGRDYLPWVLETTQNPDRRIRGAGTQCLINLYPDQIWESEYWNKDPNKNRNLIVNTFKYNATQAQPVYPDNIDAYQRLQEKIMDRELKALDPRL